MFTTELNVYIDMGKIMPADDTHITLTADLLSERISWGRGKDNTLLARIYTAYGSDIVQLHVPIDPPSTDEFPVGYEFIKEDFGGDVRMSEQTRQLLIEAGLKKIE